MLYSPVYFAACAVGGALSCGLTHTLLTPMDLIKCNRQAYPQLFSGGAFSALRGLYHGSFAPFGWGQGLRALLRGWGPTAVGYSLQGAFKFGLYELCKQRLLLSLEPMQVARYRDLVYISSSAAAELVADVALCPLEAVKVSAVATLFSALRRSLVLAGLLTPFTLLLSTSGARADVADLRSRTDGQRQLTR